MGIIILVYSFSLDPVSTWTMRQWIHPTSETFESSVEVDDVVIFIEKRTETTYVPNVFKHIGIFYFEDSLKVYQAFFYNEELDQTMIVYLFPVNAEQIFVVITGIEMNNQNILVDDALFTTQDPYFHFYMSEEIDEQSVIAYDGFTYLYKIESSSTSSQDDDWKNATRFQNLIDKKVTIFAKICII